jgi:hypothetical protein
MEGGQIEFVLFPIRLERPAVLLGGGFDVAQHGADVNRFAAVTAEIFAKLLHGDNFTQRRRDAKKFLTRLEPLGKRRKEFGETEGRKAERAGASESIARIFTNSIFQSP